MTWEMGNIRNWDRVRYGATTETCSDLTLRIWGKNTLTEKSEENIREPSGGRAVKHNLKPHPSPPAAALVFWEAAPAVWGGRD